jgi:hypothetical protein
MQLRYGLHASADENAPTADSVGLPLLRYGYRSSAGSWSILTNEIASRMRAAADWRLLAYGEAFGFDPTKLRRADVDWVKHIWLWRDGSDRRAA